MYILSQVKVTNEMLSRASSKGGPANAAYDILKHLPKLSIGETHGANFADNVADAMETFESELLGFVDTSPLGLTDYIGMIIRTPGGRTNLEHTLSRPANSLERAILEGQYTTSRLVLDICTSKMPNDQLAMFMNNAHLMQKRESTSRRLYFKKTDDKEKTQAGTLQVTTGTTGGHVVHGNLVFTAGNGSNLDGRLDSLIEAGYLLTGTEEFSWEKLDIVMECERRHTGPKKVFGVDLIGWNVPYRTNATVVIKVGVFEEKYGLTEFRLTGATKQE